MKLSTRIIAAVLSVTTLLSGSSLAAAAAEAVNADSTNDKVYIKEMKVAYGNTEQEAKTWLSNHGFTPVDGNLNKSNGTITVMGYKTTTNVNEAITDLAVMPMGGGYSIDAYNDMLDKYQTTVIEPFIESFMPAINEYRENVEAGRPQALAAQAVLNSYVDGYGLPETRPADWEDFTDEEYAQYKAGFDKISARWNDTGKPLGDAFAYGQLRSEVTENEYNANPKEYVDFSKMILQCDPNALEVIRQSLAMGADNDPNQTWVERLSDAGSTCLIDNFAEYFPSYAAQADSMTDDDKLAVISGAYEDSAKILASGFKNVSDELEWYAEFPVKIEDSEGVIDAHFNLIEELEGKEERDEEFLRWSNAAVLHDALGDISYAGDWGDTLLDFFYNHENPVDRTESFSDFYPFAAQLSPGQRAGLKFMPLGLLLSNGLKNEETWYETQEDVDESIEDVEVTGVYDNVNREIYDGGVALTNEALRKKFMEDSDPYGIVLYSSGYRSASTALLVTGTIGAALGLTLFIKTHRHAVAFMEKANKVKTALTLTKNNIKINEERLKQLIAAKNANKLDQEGNITAIGVKYKPEELTKEINDTETSIKNWKGKLTGDQFEYDRDYQMSLDNANVAKMWQYIGAGISIAFGLMAIAGGIMKIIDLATYNEPEFEQIPKYIVDEKDITETDENGNVIVLHNDYAYFKIVTCNRKAKGSAGDADHNWWTSGAQKNVDKYTKWGCGDFADLNGDVGKGWLALYTEVNPNHDPIEAGSLVVKFNNEIPAGYENAVHLFGETAAVNLNSRIWDFNENDTYVYYKTYALHTFTHGDVNHDGVVNVKDVTEIQRYAAQYIDLDEVSLVAADVTGDGEVSIADATRIQSYLVDFIPLDELVIRNG